MNYLFIYRNNASNKTDYFVTSGTEHQELYIELHTGEYLEGKNDGEYDYALVPFYGDSAYTLSFNYGGNLLDTEITCPDGKVILRDLNPATGTFRIGTVKEPKQYDKDNNKTYYYEG